MNNMILKTVRVCLFFITMHSSIQLNASFLFGGKSKQSFTSSNPLENDLINLKPSHKNLSQKNMNSAESEAWFSMPDLFVDLDPVCEKTAAIISTASIMYLNDGTCRAKLNDETVMSLPDIISAEWEVTGAITMIQENGNPITFAPQDRPKPHPKTILSEHLHAENNLALATISQSYDSIKSTVFDKVNKKLYITYLDSEINLLNPAVQNQLLQEALESVRKHNN